MINSYNFKDISILESYHSAEAFKLFTKRESNILENLAVEEYRVVRRRIIEMILATDMANHGKHYSQLKGRFEAEGINYGKNADKLIVDDVTKNFETQQIVLNMIVHSADISNPCKPLDIYTRWVDLVFQEFFMQGDIEKQASLPVSMLCDRESIDISKSQIGFIKYVVKPSLELIIQLIPECQPYYNNCNTNLGYYENKIENEEKSQI